MANELQHRDTETGLTLYFTLRKPNGIYPWWNVTGSAFVSAPTSALWGQFDIAMSETAGKSYFYLGSLPAISGNMVAGWYWAEIYEQAGASPAIDDTIKGRYFGYWDGTTFKYWGADTLAVGGTVQTAGNVLGVWTPTKAGYLDAAITSRHASGAAVAKSPATLASGDVTGNLPADVKAWDGGALPTIGTSTLTQEQAQAAAAAAITAASLALEATLTAMKGVGWSTETLKAIRDAIPSAAPTAAAIADQVWDEATSGHVAAGSFGRLIGTTWSTLFSGITSLANWLGTLAGKTADTTTRAEINATTAGATYNETTDSLEAARDNIGTAGAGLTGIGTGTGTYACTWTVNDGTTALQNATVSFRLNGVLKGTGTTGVAGTVAMSLDAGTYTVAITCDGYVFAGTTHTVSATVSTWTKTFSMSSVSWPTSTVPGTTTVRWRVRKTNRAWAGADDCTVYMGIAKGPGVAGTIYNGDNLDYDSDATDADGYVYFANTPKGSTVAVKTATDGQVQYVEIPRDCGSRFDGLELIGSA